MSRTVHRGKADASNVIPFPVRRAAPVGCGVPVATMNRIVDAWIAAPIGRIRAPAATPGYPIDPAAKKALIRELIRDIGRLVDQGASL